jgi:DNA polymerase-1
VDESNATERLGIPPDRVRDYLALIGDSSDNIPGAPGVGPKTAVKLLAEFGTLEAMLEAPDRISGKRARQALRDHADQIRLSHRLVTIQTDLPVDLDLERLRVREPDVDRLRELFVDLEFRSLIERFAGGVEGSAASGVEDADYRAVTDPSELVKLIARIRRIGEVAVDTETTSLEPMRRR